MNYNKENCIIFFNEKDLMEFFNNKIVENEIKTYDTSYNIIDLFKDIKEDVLKNLACITKYDVDVYIFKHLIISTGNLNETHVLLLWKSVLNYGLISSDPDDNVFILKIEFRTILKKTEKLFMKLDSFEYIDEIGINYNKEEFISSAFQYFFNYAKLLKINNIKISSDSIITEGYIEKYIKYNKLKEKTDNSVITKEPHDSMINKDDEELSDDFTNEYIIIE